MSDLVESMQELVEVTVTLNRDELICQKDRRLMEGENVQFWRRMCYRSFFSTVEGSCHCMKRVALKAADRFAPSEFDTEEVEQLRGERRASWKESVKFSFRSFARGYGGEIDLGLGEDDDWEAFNRANRKRDELTHPQRKSHLQVTDYEIEDLVSASKWFRRKIEEVQKIGMNQMGLTLRNGNIESI